MASQIPNNTNIIDVINVINSLSDSLTKISANKIKVTDVVKIKAKFKAISIYLDEITTFLVKGNLKVLQTGVDEFQNFVGKKGIITDMISTINLIWGSLSSILARNITPTDLIKVKLNFKYLSFYINEASSIFTQLKDDELNELTKTAKIIKELITNTAAINNTLSNVNKYNGKNIKRLSKLVNELSELIDSLEQKHEKFSRFNAISSMIISSLQALNTVVALLSAFGGVSGTGVGVYKSFKWSLLADTLTDMVKVMGMMVLMVPIMATFLILSPVIFLSMKLFMFFVRFTLKIITADVKNFTIKQYMSLKIRLNMIQNILLDIAWLSLKVILITPLILIAAIASSILFASTYILFLAIRGIIHSINVMPANVIFSAIGKLAIISILLLAIGAVVLLFALEATKIVDNWLNILIFFGAVVVYVGIVLLIGALFATGAPLITAAILGLSMTLIATSLFSLIALQLLLIQNLGLDSVSIRNVVTNIKNIVNDIINILFADVNEPEQKESGLFGSLFNIFGAAFTSLASFAKTILAIPVLVATVVSVGIITFIAAQLRWMQILKLDKTRIINNVSSVLTVAKMITDMLFAPVKSQAKPDNKPWYQNVVEKGIDWFTGKQFAPLIQSVLAVGVLAASFISTTLILFMATELRLLQNLNLDRNAIKNNVAVVINTAKDITNMLFDPVNLISDTTGDSWWDDCVNWAYKNIPGFSHIGEILNAILTVGTLALTTISVSLILFMATELRMLQAINLNSGIKDKVHLVLSTARDVISSLWDGTYNTPEKKKSWNRKLLEFCLPDSMTMFVDTVSNIGFLAPLMISLKMFSIVVEELQKVSKYNSMGVSRAKDIVSMVVSDSEYILSSLNDSKISVDSSISKKINTLNKISNAINNFAANPSNIKNQTKAIDNTVKFIETINNAKLEKLQTAHNLFKEMKEFSRSINGNFEGLADALNEKIAPLLEDLKQLLDKIPDAVDRSATTISGSVYNSSAIASGTATPSSIQSQIMAENPSMSKEDVSRMVDQRMEQQAQTVGKGIEMKLEELIDVLQNYANPIPVRMS